MFYKRLDLSWFRTYETGGEIGVVRLKVLCGGARRRSRAVLLQREHRPGPRASRRTPWRRGGVARRRPPHCRRSVHCRRRCESGRRPRRPARPRRPRPPGDLRQRRPPATSSTPSWSAVTSGKKLTSTQATLPSAWRQRAELRPPGTPQPELSDLSDVRRGLQRDAHDHGLHPSTRRVAFSQLGRHELELRADARRAAYLASRRSIGSVHGGVEVRGPRRACASKRRPTPGTGKSRGGSSSAPRRVLVEPHVLVHGVDQDEDVVLG